LLPQPAERTCVLRIRLTRKLADWIDGIDLSDAAVGDVLDVPITEAHILIAEGWAVLSIERPKRHHSNGKASEQADAADSSREPSQD
jgi:hypothetical protein